MNEKDWRKKRDDRSLRYAGRVLNSDDWIILRTDPNYAVRYDGQVAILTAANLLGRMTPSVALDLPLVPLIAPLRFTGTNLAEAVLSQLYKADPSGNFCLRSTKKDDYILHFGRTGAPTLVHGSGWNFYCGPSPSPLVNDHTTNPIGPVMAAILAISEAFRTDLSKSPEKIFFNALNWEPKVLEPDICPLQPQSKLGTLWTVGTGSVGTAILYFLSLATQDFSSVLFDMDTVKIHNLDRSPIFIADDVGTNKVSATQKYLKHAGINGIQTEPHALDEAELWQNRKQGVPDLMISTANERNVRSIIEGGFPPVQIYGTTGKNWQATLLRHIPIHDPCSTCVFPETKYKQTQCATAPKEEKNGEDQVDAALPFLSFAAGAMAAAEILKLNLSGYPFTPNKVVLSMCNKPRIVKVSSPICENCLCQKRSTVVHRKMIENTLFAHLKHKSA